MNNPEIKKRNLLTTISQCLQEHQVGLAGERGIVPMYLIEVQAPSNLFKDLVDTYGEEVSGFKRKLAEKALKSEPFNQTYGVLVNTDLQYSFAFNRKFADLDRKGKRIAFRGVEDLLIEMSTGQDLSQIEMPEDSSPQGESFGHGGTAIRYSILGKRDGKNDKPIKCAVNYEKASLLDRVKNLYARNEVRLESDKNKWGSFYLVNTFYKTPRLTDFLRTYNQAGEVDNFREKLAERVFGKKKTENQYGLLLSPDLQIKFAFNEQFARYDRKSNSMIYTPVEKALLEQTKSKKIDLSEGAPQILSGMRKRRYDRPTVMRYALVGK